MKKRAYLCVMTCLLATVVAGVPAWGATAGKEQFTLVSAVPNDVFLCIAGTKNPERAFLDEYWADVTRAMKDAGLEADLMELVSSLMGKQQMEEVNEVKDKALRLFSAVDWSALAGKESVFAERMTGPQQAGSGVHMGPPDILAMFRGSEEGAAKNFDALVNLLEGIVGEINTRAGDTYLTVQKAEKPGLKMASVNVLASVQGAPPMPITIGLHKDVIVMALGQVIFTEAVGLLQGETSVKPLSGEARYNNAFKDLPPAEDMRMFFDMQRMMAPIKQLVQMATGGAGAGQVEDVVVSQAERPDMGNLLQEAWDAYEAKRYDEALRLTKEAQQKAPKDPMINYNVACLHALKGNKQEAIEALGKAVDCGFYSPGKIATDPDLESLRGMDGYTAVLAEASKLAAKHQGTGGTNEQAKGWREVMDRILGIAEMIDYIASVEFTEDYSVRADTAVVLAPGAKQNPFYPVIGNRKELTTFDRYLPKETKSFSVNNGIDLEALYKFILDTFRAAGPQGEAMLAEWERMQQEWSIDMKKDVLGWIEGTSISVTLDTGSDQVTFLKVTDEEVARSKVSAAVDFLATKLTEAAAEQPMLAMMAVRKSPVTNEKLEGFENIYFGMSPQPVLWGVADGHLILATSERGVLKCLETAKGEHPSVQKNEQVMEEVIKPDGAFSCISLTDYRTMGQEIAGALGMVSMMSGMLTMSMPPEAKPIVSKIAGMMAKLAPVVSKIDFYKSSSSVTTFNGQRWYTRVVTHYFSPSERAGSATAAATGS